MTPETESTYPDRAVYSPDMLYRYEFQRRWAPATDPDLDTIAWVLLNPGTGDTDGKPRPTLRRCIEWSQRWGFASLAIVNLFAYRTTKPAALYVADDPVGPDNDETLDRVCADAGQVMVAWGAHGELRGRGREVAERVPTPVCLGVTSKGEPRHPLYVAAATEPRPYVLKWQA